MKNYNSSLYKIGEAAKLTGTRASQLRFYEQVGVLSPEYRDDESEYRLYSYDQLVEIETIISMQEMGFTLKQIKALLSDGNFFLERSCYLSQERIKEIDKTIEKLIYNRECMRTYNRLCATFLSEYNLKNYTIESLPQHNVILSKRHVKLDVESDAKEMLTAMNLHQKANSPIEDWYMSAYAYKVRINKTDLSDLEAELCVILCDGVTSRAAFEEPSRLYAKTTQAIRIDEIPSHVDKLLQLIQQAGLVPMPYYYVLLIAKDKSGHDSHIRQIRIPIETV
jgi:DNA-binding transcriptional MerR regulator